MKRNTRWIAVSILIILTTALAACQAATPIPDELLPTEVPEISGPAAPTSITLEGAETTANGVQYLEQVAGDGRTPQDGDILTMNFVLSLPDGTQVINSQEFWPADQSRHGPR